MGLRADFDNVHSGYIRLRNLNLNWGSGDALDGNDSDHIGPKVDLFYYQLDIDEALRTYWGKQVDFDMQLRAGRQFITLGRGWLYLQRNDAVQLDGSVGLWDYKAFVANSITSDDNIDASAPDPDHSNRWFYGGEVGYTIQGRMRHRPYAMVLVQRDQSGTEFHDPVLKYDYDSEYYGGGITGWVTPQVEYFAEGVIQRGKSTAANRAATLTHHEDIDSCAWNIGMNWYPRHPMNPRLGLEFARATGDSDRGHPSLTIGGNAIYTRDRSFHGFGFMDTGYAFAQEFSNLQFISYGADVQPLAQSDSPLLRRLKLGTKVYHLWKDEADGGTTHPLDDRSSSNLGHELDFYLDWQLRSDLKLTVQYGIYFPGQSITETADAASLSGGRLFSFCPTSDGPKLPPDT